MSRILLPDETFPVRGGKEPPIIPGLKFAAFFGQSPGDNLNLVPGGAPFTNIGSGPAPSTNFATFTPGSGSLSTGMTDNPTEFTMVFAAMGNPSFAYGTLARFEPGQSSIYMVWSAVASPPRYQVFSYSSGAQFQGSPIVSMPCPVGQTWTFYAATSKVGQPAVFHDFTSGTVVPTANPIAGTSRPIAGNWNIGCIVPVTGFDQPMRIAFALGANHAMTQADLQQLADAVRYRLSLRNIVL